MGEEATYRREKYYSDNKENWHRSEETREMESSLAPRRQPVFATLRRCAAPPLGEKMSKTLIAAERDVRNRLESIIFHLEEIYSYFSELSNYKRDDCEGRTARYPELKRLLARIQANEIDAIYELVHLSDNLDKYLKASSVSKKVLEEVSNEDVYKIPANYVNSHKHGLRGRGAKSAKLDYYYLVYKQTDSQQSGTDELFVIASVVNYDGKLYPLLDLILGLAELWMAWLQKNGKFNIVTVVDRITCLISNLSYVTKYSKSFLQNVTDDAQRLAEERKYMNI